MSSSQRNRAEGWQHAKTSGHTNEENILELLQKDAAYREFFLKRLKKEHLEIKDINIGGLHEKQVPSTLQGEKPTNAKPDLWITFSDGSSANISIKKSDSGQVYLVTGKHFLNGYEKQFKCSIPDDVKQGINLFFGQDYDSVMNFFKIDKKDLLIIHDDLDMPVGKMRFRAKGSDGGQKGIRSIIQMLGGANDFDRLKLGIGPQLNLSAEAYVLQNFSDEQKNKRNGQHIADNTNRQRNIPFNSNNCRGDKTAAKFQNGEKGNDKNNQLCAYVFS